MGRDIQLLAQDLGSARISEFSPDREKLVGHRFVVLLERVLDDDPIKHAQAAAEQERAAAVKRTTSCELIERASVGFEDIADAANRVDQFYLEGVVDFGAQPTHDHIDDIRIGLETNLPDVCDDLAARNNFTAGAEPDAPGGEILSG